MPNTATAVLPILFCLLKFSYEQELENHVFLDDQSNYLLLWTANEEDITIELQVNTTGYVGFGFSPNGGMNGADVIIGWVYPNKTSIFHDRHALGSYMPLIDKEQNWHLLNSSENATHTVLRFTRKLDTCDKAEDIAITDDTMKVIYSWHPNDPQDEKAVPHHEATRRGTKNIYFLTAKPANVKMTDDIYTWDVVMPNIPLPPQLTTYWCFTVKLPKFDVPHQYVGFDIDINPGHEMILHHLMFFQCVGNNTHFEEQVADKAGYECVTEGAVLQPMECQPPLILWAIGAEGSALPDGVGIPVGEEYGGASYYLMQVHYNNPELKSGIVDNSKVKVYLSKKPQPNTSGILQLYANFDYTLAIPPQHENFPITAYCPQECTQNVIPKDGITVYATGIHAHLTGRKISLHQFRDGKELPPITVDNHFDFNYQKLRNLKNPVKILPGDLLLGICEYNTMDRYETVPGGYGTAGEMCFLYMYYYPAIDLSLCIGGPDYKTVQNFFGAEEMEPDMVHIKLPLKHQNRTIHDLMKEYNWKSASESAKQEIYHMQFDGLKQVTCAQGWQGNNKVDIVKIQYPYNASFYSVKDVCDIKEAPKKTEKPYY